MLFRSICKLFNTSRVSAYQLYSTESRIPRMYSLPSYSELEHKIYWDIRDATTPVTPIVNQWVQDGRSITHENIQDLIAFLCGRGFYTHALELSEWMRESEKYDLTTGDIADHLKLLSKVRGLEQTENFYGDIPNSRIRFKINAALLECYAEHKSLEKAEALMKKIKKIHPISSPICYNTMLKLYAQLGKYDKLDTLMPEMMEKGIHNHATYTILFDAYVVAGDIQGIEKILTRMEVDPRETVHWRTYSAAAYGYLKGGNAEKALSALKKIEQLALSYPCAYESILTMYAAIGNKDEIYRIWEKCKIKKPSYNRRHFFMLSALVKLGDIVGAEKILEEWESNYKVFDTRIPHLMIHTYCKLGMFDKAEAYIKRLLDSGKELPASTWESLAEHYCADNNMEKAVQAMKNVFSAERTSWRPKAFVLAACLEYLKEKGDLESVLQILEFYSDRWYLSVATYDKLVSYVHGEIPDAKAIDLIRVGIQLDGDTELLDEELCLKVKFRSQIQITCEACLKMLPRKCMLCESADREVISFCPPLFN